MIKVRLAPSPTGPLHIGTARTALFNFLFARGQKGQFILRFEDTDQSRSTKEYEKNITENLKWLGLDWDEKPSYQMERLEKYQKAAAKLVKRGYAKEIEGAVLLRAKTALEKLKIDFKPAVKISGYGNNSQIDQELAKHKDPSAYLVKNIAKDLIHGSISGLIMDTVLLRRDQIPTFHLAVVVDDADMKISHVIRGDDHFSNTPLHVVLQKALGCQTPLYAHIPLILDTDRNKMSKRKGQVDISQYRQDGYLPAAMVNFLALLGWSASGADSNQQIFSIKELIEKFDLSRVQKSPAVFDRQKLDYLNGYYIRKLEVSELDKLLQDGYYPKTEKNTLELTAALQTRMVKLSQSRQMSEFFFGQPIVSPDLLVFKKSDPDKTKKGLAGAAESLIKAPAEVWRESTLNQVLAKVVKKENLANGDVFWPVRAALSGAEQSPSPAELLQILGRDESLDRIKKAIKKLT